MKRIIFCCLSAVAVSACGASSQPQTNEAFVCGDDGVSYTVEDAAKGNVTAAHRGRCGNPMTCEDAAGCFVGDECTQVDGNDVCVPGVCDCLDIYDPVCGNDGQTYGNGCVAQCAGVDIKHEGPCEEPPGTGCVRGGCSGQLCLEEGMEIASTCEWKDVYACYQAAECARQPNGQCSFTPTHELVECLNGHGEGCDSDLDCPLTHKCQHVGYLDAGLPTLTEKLSPPEFRGMCVEACALIDCAPGYACEHGSCVPQDGTCRDNSDCDKGDVCNPVTKTCGPRCAIDCFRYDPVCGVDGKTYGCGEADAHCNGIEVAYPGECKADCRTEGCDGDGFTCVDCHDGNGGTVWECLGPNQGRCEPPPSDCRVTGCSGQICADEDVATTCEWLDEYECYQKSRNVRAPTARRMRLVPDAGVPRVPGRL